MRKNSLLIILLFISCVHSAQKITNYKTVGHSKINLNNYTDNWMINLQSQEMPKPGGDSYRSFLLDKKKIASDLYPRSNKQTESKPKQSSSIDLIIENGFEGNLYNNRIPNDNTMCISDDGIIVAGINSMFIFYDTNNDSLIKRGTLNTFAASFISLLSVNKYDPKFIYDPIEDKFIVTFLIGTAPATSHIFVAFSSNNNPMDDWNAYILKGDALNTGHWIDYPAISITEDELFITGNLLSSGVSWQLGFNQSLIWQIDKESGYNGLDSLDYAVWSDIKDDSILIRNIHPARGARELQSKEQYFLSNKNFSSESDTLYLMKVSNTLASDSAEFTIERISLPNHYFLSPNGRQSIPKELSTNDSRVLGATIDEEWIQYVHHSMDTAHGTSGIYHGIIENYNSTPVVTGRIISDSIKDYGYPNIASTGINKNEKEGVIGFNYTSPIDTNGTACFYMNNDEEYSNFTYLKRGEAPINRSSGNTIDRWGDYFGIQRKYDEPCRVWMSGMYGKTNKNGSWISSVAVSDTCRTPTPPQDTSLNPIFSNGTLFPNPVLEWFNYDFNLENEGIISIELFDIEGRLIKNLYDDYVSKGENRISFNISHLNTGIYIMTVSNTEEILFRKKMFKN